MNLNQVAHKHPIICPRDSLPVIEEKTPVLQECNFTDQEKDFMDERKNYAKRQNFPLDNHNN